MSRLGSSAMRKVVSTVGRFLGNPVVSKVGNAAWLLSLVPFGAALVSAVVGRVLDQPTLFLVAVGLAMLGFIVVAIGAVRERRVGTESPQGPSIPFPGLAPHSSTESPPTTFVAVEGEIALAAEEAAELVTMLHREWPHITPEGTELEAALPSWRNKTTDFIGTVLGSASRAAFRAAGTGNNTLERLESEGRFLVDLAQKLAPDSVRANEAEILKARKRRREHKAASFMDYDHFRAPGAPLMPDSTGASSGSTDKRPPWQEDQAQPSAPNGPLAPIEGLYSEGKAMLLATNPMTVGMVFGPAPTDAKIDNWKGRVLSALPEPHRKRFRLEPLDPKPFTHLALMPIGDSQQAGRLRNHLAVLERIMKDMAEPQHSTA